MLWTYCMLLEQGLTAFPWVPPSLFNILARVAHSLAMWPQPWHLKHCKVLESLVLWAPSCAPYCTHIFPLLWDSVLSLVVVEELQMEAVWPRPVQPLWELGQTGVFLSTHPLPWPMFLGLLGALVGWLPCSTLVKAAISLAIWSPSSFDPETTSVVAADLTLTLSFVLPFCFPLFALWPPAQSRWFQNYHTNIWWSLSHVFEPHEKSFLEVLWHLMVSYSPRAS